MAKLFQTSNLEKDFTKIKFLIVWLLANGFVFWWKFTTYYGTQYHYLHQMLGYGLCVSRASAACINLNAAILLVPMCRKCTGFLLKLFKMPNRSQTMSLYRYIHIYCASMLCFLAVVHCVAHSFNAVNFCSKFDPMFAEINLAKTANQKGWIVMLTTWPGISGVLILITLTIITIFAVSPFRKANYNRFLKTHYLFSLFYIFLICHSMKGVIKYQTNTEDHSPNCDPWSNKMKMMTNKSDSSNAVNSTPLPFNNTNMQKMQMDGQQ